MYVRMSFFLHTVDMYFSSTACGRLFFVLNWRLCPVFYLSIDEDEDLVTVR